MTSDIQAATGPLTDAGASPTGHPAAMRSPWVTVFVMQFLYIVAMIDRNLVSLLVAPIKAQLGITDFQISLLQGTAFGLFFVLCGLLTGWLLDRFARRKVVYWGVTIWSLCAASCGLATSYFRLLLGRFGVGAGEAVLSPASYAMISAQFPRERLGFAMGVWATGSIIGGALSLSLGSLVVGWLTERGPAVLPLLGTIQPWQQAFLFFGLPGLVIAPLVFVISRDVDRPVGGSHEQAGDFLRFIRARRTYLVLHFLGFGFVTLIAYGQSAWLPTYLLRRFGLNLAVVGNMLALASASGGIIGFLVGGRLTDRWFAAGQMDAHFRYALIATIALTIVGIIAYLVPSWGVCIVLTMLCYMTMAISGIAAANLQISTPPPLRARVSALFLVVVNVIGLTMGPSVVAAFTDFLFADPARVGSSILLTYAIFGPLATIAFWFGRKPAEQAIRAAIDNAKAADAPA